MTVRPFVDADLERIASVHSRSRQVAYDGLVPADALAEVTPEAQIEVWRERLLLGATIFVGERDGEVLGFATLLETDEGTELNAIHLLPEAIGTGLGAALMEVVIEAARSGAVERCTCSCSRTTSARRPSTGVRAGDSSAMPGCTTSAVPRSGTCATSWPCDSNCEQASSLSADRGIFGLQVGVRRVRPGVACGT